MATKRPVKSDLSAAGQKTLAHYERHLCDEADLSPATIRGYLGDARLFMVWCEQTWSAGKEIRASFAPDRVTTPLITRYRDYLKNEAACKPTTVNRYLLSLKRYFAWATEQDLLARDPAQVVKLVGQEASTPRHLSDEEEDALLAAVEADGNLRDRTLITLMLHTGLRVGEVCQLKQQHVKVGRRSGRLRIWGKGNKYREVPLNATARQALAEYQATLSSKAEYLFPSRRTGDRLTPRAIGFIVKKYARRAGVPDVSPHDLRHRFGYRMAENVPLHRLAQIMGHDSLDTTIIYIRGTQRDLQQAVETIAWK